MFELRWWILALAGLSVVSAAEPEGKIMRPANLSAFASGEIDVVATAPGGRLEIDGKPLDAEQPFPNVFHALAQPAPGEHVVALIWERGRAEAKVFVGDNPPPSYQLFRPHPPGIEVECTQCHGVSSRGRFRFVGGCFDCHTEEQFAPKHSHASHVLERCGDCHNAHGSTAQALMIHPKETACQLCHGL